MNVKDYVKAWLVIIEGKALAFKVNPLSLSPLVLVSAFSAETGKAFETTAGRIQDAFARARFAEVIPPLEWTAEDERNEKRAARAGLLAV